MKKDFFYYTTLNYNHETDYTYDNAYRLTGFDVDGTSSTTYDRTFTYDRNGNRQKRNSDNYLYGWEQSEDTGLNQLKSAHSKTYTYDANGNIATFDGNTFAYDYRNLCTGVTGSVARTYSYDASGRRVKETDGSTHYYIYDGNTLIAEYTGSTLTAKYIYGNGKILKVDGNGIEWYYMNDHLGSRRVLYSSQGEIGDDYYPFGEIMQHQGNENGYNKFTGKRRDDALGMDHFFARDYLPQTSRFNGSDPVMEYSNPYSYVANRPMNFVDPLGMRSKRNNAGGDSEVYPRGGLLAGGGIMGTSYYVDGVEVTGSFFNNASGYANLREMSLYSYNARGYWKKKPWGEVGVAGKGEWITDDEDKYFNDEGIIEFGDDLVELYDLEWIWGTNQSIFDPVDPATLYRNGFGTMHYPGPLNPKRFSGKSDFSTSPVDLSGVGPYFHDIEWEDLGISGINGMIFETSAIPSDFRLVSRELIISFSLWNIDPVTSFKAAMIGVGYGAFATPKTILFFFRNRIR